MHHVSHQPTRSAPHLNSLNTFKATQGAVPFIHSSCICHGAVTDHEFLLHFYGAFLLGVPCFKFMHVSEHYLMVKKLCSVSLMAHHRLFSVMSRSKGQTQVMFVTMNLIRKYQEFAKKFQKSFQATSNSHSSVWLKHVSEIDYESYLTALPCSCMPK